GTRKRGTPILFAIISGIVVFPGPGGPKNRIAIRTGAEIMEAVALKILRERGKRTMCWGSGIKWRYSMGTVLMSRRGRLSKWSTGSLRRAAAAALERGETRFGGGTGEANDLATQPWASGTKAAT